MKNFSLFLVLISVIIISPVLAFSNTHTKIRKVVVIVVMEQEAQPIVEKFSLRKIKSAFAAAIPVKAYKGKIDQLRIFLIVNGKDKRYGVDNVATQPATITTLLAIEKFKPDLIINAGTAGGLGANGAQIGDVYVSSKSFKFHDRRIPIPGYAEYGIGSYPAWDASKMAKNLGLKTGIVSTGNSLDMTKMDEKIIKSNNATIKDMEAAAIAWVAQLFDVPVMSLKSVTDLVDSNKPTQEEFLKNLSLATKNLQLKLAEVLKYCSGKSVNELSN